jgi:hypothetical protein
MAGHFTAFGSSPSSRKTCSSRSICFFGLFEMLAQAFGQIAVGRLVDHLGKRLHDLVLGVEDVLQAMQEQVVHRGDVLAEEAHGFFLLWGLADA